MMKYKSIAAIILSIFVLIAGGCSPADNTHAMRMNYQSERYTDEDFETVTEMIIKDLQQNHPERKAVRFAYAGDKASDNYGSLVHAQEDRDCMLFFIHFEDIHDDEFICFFSISCEYIYLVPKNYWNCIQYLDILLIAFHRHAVKS